MRRTGVDGQAETLEIPARVREEVYERDGGLCRVCGSYGESLALHHLLFRSQGGKHEASNLISVHWMYQPRCHEEYMHGRDALTYRKLGLQVVEQPGVTIMQLKRWEESVKAPTLEETAALFWAKVDICGVNECWDWQRSTDRNGYGQLSAKALRPAPIKAHVMAFFLTHGRWPRPACLHRCDRPICVNPSHLYEGDQAQNMRDRKERNPRFGAANPAAKYADKVEVIRARVAAGESQASVCRDLGLSSATVSRIVTRTTYP